MRFKRTVFIFLFACAALLSSCSEEIGNDETASPEITAVSTETASVTEETTAENETSAAIAESGTSAPEQITEITVTSRTVTEETSSVSETETPETSASEPVSQEVTVTSSAETTSAAAVTTAKPPAEVVIPKIKMPSSPGTDVISGENAEVDHSCASEGYISAVYTGSSAAAKIRIQLGDVQYNHDLSTGGKREYFPLMGDGDYTVSVYEQFSGKKYALVASGEFSVNIADPTGMYLYPNKYVDFDSSSDCVRKAAELCAGMTGDVEKIAAIFMYITDNVTYDSKLAATVQSGYVPYPDATLSSKTGICYDYASLFAAMCRSQGIPARLVIGYADPDIYHAWNEVYTDETGWITPELFLRNKGYNIADATFYAGNPDKEKISEYISDSGNYSAIYRY